MIRACALRLLVAPVRSVEWRSCCFLSPYHGALAVKGCKEALRLNAAAVIFAHNHPSGNPETSQADKVLTQRLREALALVDVRSLDHVIVAGQRTVSFAELGLL